MPFDPDDVIVDGLTTYVQLSGDKKDAELGGYIYKTVADAFRSHLSAGDTCALAFPSMIIRPDIRTQCFVAVLDSDVVVAWKKGVIRKTLETEVIPRARITSADVETGSSGATRGATMLTIKAGETVTLALPKGRKDLWAAIRQAVLPTQPAPGS